MQTNRFMPSLGSPLVASPDRINWPDMSLCLWAFVPNCAKATREEAREVASLFFSYSHADENLRDQLETQLAMLRRQGAIEVWHDRRIGAGDEFEPEIMQHVENDDIILLLVSPNFLASDYCYDREMLRAMERHEAGEAIVIPVILRACEWHHAPFGKINATPPDGKPITQWPDRDQAFLEVAKAIRKAVEKLEPGAQSAQRQPTVQVQGRLASEATNPRSSNLRLAKQFTERHKDQFRVDSFEFIARYFQNSLAELQDRNDGIEGVFRRVDGSRFTASVYRNGKALARCTIFLGGGFTRNGIAFVHGETDSSNTLNESLSVDADDQSLFLKSFGMSAAINGKQEAKLSQEGAAEHYWAMLIEPLQHN